MRLSFPGCIVESLPCLVGTNVQRWLLGLVVACLAWLAAGVACAAESGGSAAALYVKYEALQRELERNAFARPLHLDSREADDELQGDVHAILGYPFAQVRGALQGEQPWCDILILHLNVKACRVAPGGSVLQVYIGKKFDEPPRAAHEIEFAYRVLSATADYLRLSLTAASGPFGTRDYRIIVEAVPLEGQRTFLHLSYAYGYGLSAKVAMQTYLRTIGGSKVGFTVDGRRPDGRPALVGGLRGALERNVMRYYLAVDAYLAALAAPPDERLEERLREWFDGTERYALQLHELDEGTYLEMKRRECDSLSAER